MIERLGSEKGSSTILITLLLVILFLFAVLSITTTSTELKLARRNAETNKSYYTLDSEGKRFLFSVKSATKEALEMTDNMSEQFFIYLDGLLDQGIIRTIENNTSNMKIERTIILEENSRRKYLDIQLMITAPQPESSVNDIVTILEWKLSQEPFKYENKVDLWEGIP